MKKALDRPVSTESPQMARESVMDISAFSASLEDGREVAPAGLAGPPYR
jgi:hypothetical protein